MRYKMLWGLLAVVGLLVSCSSSNDDDISGLQKEVDEALLVEELKAAKGYYEGVWSVNQLPLDTARIGFNTTDYWGVYFYDLPFKAIVSRLLPEVEVDSITAQGFIVGAQLNPQEALYLKAIINSAPAGDYLGSSILSNYFHKVEMIGFSAVNESNRKGFFRLPAAKGSTYRCMPFVVTEKRTDESSPNSYFAVILSIDPTKSTITIDVKNNQIMCILSVARMELMQPDEKRTEKPLSGNVELKFTGTRKIDSW